MDAKGIVEERMTFPSGDLTLAGVLAYPASTEPAMAALVCPPHPHFAGDMKNNVIRALGAALAEEAVTLRFDYRGVGKSGIDLPPGVGVFDYWSQIEESKNYEVALDDVSAAAAELFRVAPGLPAAVVGYSFGALAGLTCGCDHPAVGALAGISPPLSRVSFAFLSDCAKPTLLLSGRDDFVCPAAEMDALAAKIGPRAKVEVVQGSDHFFRGDEGFVCVRVREHIRHALTVECGERR